MEILRLRDTSVTPDEISELISQKMVLTEPPETSILPDEIWVKIFRELPIAHLNTIRMVSKHFFAISSDRDAVGRTPSKNISISGPSGSGKTSLIGRLLYEFGNYTALGLKAHTIKPDQEIRIGHLAPLVDANNKRSVSDVARFEVYRPEHGYNLHLISTPGKQKHLRNAIAGIVQADYNIMVLDIDMAQLKPGDKRLDQVADQMRMLKALGMRQLIILVNKMDSTAFGGIVDAKELEEQMSRAFHQLKQWIDDTAKRSLWGKIKPIVIPISVHTGANVLTRDGLGKWADYFPSVAELLDGLRNPNREFHRPLRLVIDRTHSVKGVGTVFVGTILQGTVREGQHVLVGPCDDELYPVRSLHLALSQHPTAVGVAGDYIALAIPAVAAAAGGGAIPPNPHLNIRRRHGRIAGLPRDVDVCVSLATRRRQANLMSKKTAAEQAYELLERQKNGALYACAEFTANIAVFKLPGKNGSVKLASAEFVMHVHNTQAIVRAVKIEEVITASHLRGEKDKTAPATMTMYEGEVLRVRFKPHARSVCLDVPQNCARLGRIILRVGGLELSAAGVVQETYYRLSEYFKKPDHTLTDQLVLGAKQSEEKGS